MFHAAGANCSESIKRMANLLQVSSAFGRTMEAIDTRRLVAASYPALQQKMAREGMSVEVQAFIAAVAEGYPFPANLDKTPSRFGMAPETEQDLLRCVLQEA